jgi:hypothetical protein
MSGTYISDVVYYHNAYSGNYEIKTDSKVYKDGTPIALRKVWLFNRVNGKLLAETWSATDGSFSFPYIMYQYQGYYLIAFDYGSPLRNAAIADLVTPSLMAS